MNGALGTRLLRKACAYIGVLYAAASIDLSAQCLYNRTAFESYFDSNIASLNPIEGFWSVTLNEKVYLNGRLVASNEKSQIKEWAIVRVDGSTFRVCDVYGENLEDWRTEFTSTVNGSIYLYKKSTAGEVTTSNAVMTSIGLLEYSYEMGVNEMKAAYKEKYQNGLRVFRDFKWIKIFPTSEIPVTNHSSSGTGFAISSKGMIATSFHVVKDAKRITVRGINGNFSTAVNAEVAAIDKQNDLAILRLASDQASTIGRLPYSIRQKPLDVGERVFSLGYPLRATMGDEVKLTDGIVSSKSGYQSDVTAHQITVPVQPGNSGGPLFDINGNIAGVINAKHLEAENAAYAVKAGLLRNLIETLSEYSEPTTTSSLSALPFVEKVKALNAFVYIIEVH